MTSQQRRLQMEMTYRDLLENIKAMSNKQLDQTVVIYVSGSDEFYPLVEDFPYVETNQEIQNEFTPGATSSFLDDGHVYLVI